MAVNALTNTGMKFIGDETALRAAEKTLIVVGPPRSGTSLVSGALDHLGVFTGDRSRPHVYEDVRLATACEQGTGEDIEAVIADYNARYPLWAHKRPHLVGHFGRLHGRVRNPVYLFIFKDIFSMANRNNISMQMDLMAALRFSLKQYRQILGFIERRSPNGVLLSYDRVMQDKERFVDLLIDLVAPQEVAAHQREAALAFITRDPAGYLHESRLTRAEGAVTHLDVWSVQGHAAYHRRPNAPVEVEVAVDGLVCGTAVATGPGPEGAGICFTYEFPAPLPASARLSLRLTDDPVPFAEDLHVGDGVR